MIPIARLLQVLDDSSVVPRMRGHHIKIVQDGTMVLLVDTDTGVVGRIDPSQLKITTSRAAGGPALQVLAGAAYTIALVVHPDGTRRVTLPAPVAKAENGVRVPPVAINDFAQVVWTRVTVPTGRVGPIRRGSVPMGQSFSADEGPVWPP